jgi:hypothetical protein
MKGKCANIISVESKEESIISFYLKSSASDRYGETCLNLAADSVVDCNTPNSSV